MAAILNTVTQLFTAAVDWVGDVAGLITANTDGVPDNPLLLVFCCMPLVGLGVGLFKRLINVN